MLLNNIAIVNNDGTITTKYGDTYRVSPQDLLWLTSKADLNVLDIKAVGELLASKFNQLCVWEGTTLDGKTPEDFERFMLSEFGARIKFAEVVITNGSVIHDEEGGRSDLLFFVHDDDIGGFAIPRLEAGIRWWEDVVSYNKRDYRYSGDILEKYPVRW